MDGVPVWASHAVLPLPRWSASGGQPCWERLCGWVVTHDALLMLCKACLPCVLQDLLFCVLSCLLPTSFVKQITQMRFRQLLGMLAI